MFRFCCACGHEPGQAVEVLEDVVQIMSQPRREVFESSGGLLKPQPGLKGSLLEERLLAEPVDASKEEKADSLERGPLSAVTPAACLEVRPPREQPYKFRVRLCKDENILGMALDVKLKGVQIMRIGAGAVQRHNDRSSVGAFASGTDGGGSGGGASDIVRPGDFIVGVNGITDTQDFRIQDGDIILSVNGCLGSAARIVEQIKTMEVLELSLGRIEP